MTEYQEYRLEDLTNDIPIANLISFQQWQTLKQYGNLTKGQSQFKEEELDEIVVFYDDNMNYLDYLSRKEIENIIPAFVLVPRFFWETHHENLPVEFIPGMKVQERLEILRNETNQHWIAMTNRVLYEPDKPFNTSMVPRPEQVPVLDFFMDKMQQQHNIRGVLQAPPGSGKTAMTIELMSRYKAKALIVVPNEVLSDQWQDAILQFTDLNQENIGVIQGSEIDKIQAQMIGGDIFIVKIQSLYSQVKRNDIRELQKLYRDIDVVVYDECHNSGAATGYAKTSSIFMTPNILGLSATPYRVGLNDYLLRTSIGETIFKLEHNNLDPEIEIHNVWTEFRPKELQKLGSVAGEYTMLLAIFNAMMKGKDQYFEYLADVVAWNHSQGHNIVVLFATIALMEKLQKNIQERHPGTADKVLLLKGKTKTDALDLVKIERKRIMQEYKEYKAQLDIKVKNKELKRKEANVKIKEMRAKIDQDIEFLKEHSLDVYKARVKESEIIISNYNLLSAGFDKPQLSNIIFGGAPRVGKISVIQSIGRITRKHEGKLTPLVQYFIPSTYFNFQKSTGVILNRNIKVQYPDAKFKYIGFQQ